MYVVIVAVMAVVIVMLTIFLGVVFIQYKQMHEILERAAQVKTYKKSLPKPNRKPAEYWLARYERIKNAEALSNIPPHYVAHIDGMCWHHAKIEKCYVVYFSGLEGRYICLLLDKNDTITHDNEHAIELNVPSAYLSKNRTINNFDECVYTRFTRLKESDIERLRSSGVDIMNFESQWISELNINGCLNSNGLFNI